MGAVDEDEKAGSDWQLVGGLPILPIFMRASHIENRRHSLIVDKHF